MGAKFSEPVRTDPGAHPSSYVIGMESFPGIRRPGRGVDHPPTSTTRLKKEYRYTSIPLLGIRGLF